MISFDFTRLRALATRNAQAQLAAPPQVWVWPQRTVAQWDTDITLFDQLRIAENATHADWRNAAESWQVNLHEVQDITRLVASIGRVQFRNDPVKRISFEKLKTDGESRADIYAQGLSARDFWERADAAWTVGDEAPVTLGQFSSLLTASLVLQGSENAKRAAWRTASSAFMQKATVMDRDSVDWYAEATRRFPAGTTPGEMIRSTVPTTARPVQPVQQAVITNLMVSGGAIHFDASAEHATRYTYLHQLPGSAVFLVEIADTPSSSLTLHGQPAGVHRFKVAGSNSDGEGPESAVVEATVAQANVA